MSTSSTPSRIAPARTYLGSIRLSIKLLILGIVADAATTVYGISIMGLYYEAGPLPSIIIPWLWRTAEFGLNIGEAAGLYAYGYVLVGVGIAAVLQHLDGDEEFQQLPAVQHAPPVFTAVFTISPVVNLLVLAQWIASMPNAGWL